MSFAVIIPALETNKYHKLGDLAPFGDTTLLEWKISQCKEFSKSSQIYISSDSELIEGIAQKEEVNFIKRKSGMDYQDVILQAINEVQFENILWLISTTPFMGSITYLEMYKFFIENNLISLVSVEKKQEYVFFENQRLNFKKNEFTSRKDIEPIYIATNGCYIIKKDLALSCKNLLSANPSFFEVDSFVATEIKDVQDYEIARDMISLYFKKEVLQ